MTKQFVTSDLHFGHSNIIKYCPDSRGHLTGVDQMNAEIINRFNEVVGKEDHTYILGDFAFCKPEQAMKFMAQMNGTKTLIHGNHDRKLVASMEFRNPSVRRMAGLVEDTPYKVISHSVDGVKYGVVLFHFRIASWDGAHHGSIHLYGHEHGNGPVMTTRCMDIGADTNHLRPYQLDRVVAELAKRELTKSGHHDGNRE